MVKAKKLWSKNIVIIFVCFVFLVCHYHWPTMRAWNNVWSNKFKFSYLAWPPTPASLGSLAPLAISRAYWRSKFIVGVPGMREGEVKNKMPGQLAEEVSLVQSFCSRVSVINFLEKQIGIAKGIFSSFCCVSKQIPQISLLNIHKAAMNLQTASKHDTWCSEKFLSLTACSHAVFTTKAYTWFKVHWSSFAAAISLRRPLRTFLGLNQMFLIQDFDHNLG